MYYILTSILIYSSWQVGTEVIKPLRLSDNSHDILSVAAGAIIFFIISLVIPVLS